MNSRATLHEYRTFLSRALQRPSTVGAVLPTSQHVASAVADVVPATGTPTVVELGPGTGALTDLVEQRLPSGSRHLAVEIDPDMVDYLRRSRPWLEVHHADAADLPTLLNQQGITHVDAVISSIPWTLLPLYQQRRALDAVAHSLAPHGVFTALTYITALWRPGSAAFDRALRTTFEEVVPRTPVWRNVPPARVYICRRARP
ncbi:methyltransferase domain-containing protein [Allosaccharopolyspora coralli]|uniref:Methyltransferase domain-containing protein n=1 Tax=Allosaccharopolyspora coralli TaxID=2665642 RepID=A0A5Q3QLN6_9PSEU|nr:methyltransferase domain-containing protein [Allosaccharopolyspora coralli]